MKSLLFGVLFLTLVASTQAALIFDNSSRADFTSTRGAGDSPLASITVSAPTDINQIGQMVDLDANGNMKFLLFDLNSLTLLFSTTSAAYIDDGLTFKTSSVFPTFTLLPGTTYGIGAIADVGGLWSTNNSSGGNPFTQNNITASDDQNGNVSNFASPSLSCCGSAMIIIQLNGPGAVPIPEPTTWALMGAGIAGLFGLKFRKR